MSTPKTHHRVHALSVLLLCFRVCQYPQDFAGADPALCHSAVHAEASDRMERLSRAEQMSCLKSRQIGDVGVRYGRLLVCYFQRLPFGAALIELGGDSKGDAQAAIVDGNPMTTCASV